MRCKKVQELILTDYLDGEMDPAGKEELDTHLKECSGCRSFESAVRKNLIEPFNAVEKETPPISIWHNISEAIQKEQEKAADNPVAGLLRRLRSLLVFPKPTFALATVTAVIIMALVVTKLQPPKQSEVDSYLEEQTLFLDSLEADINGSFNGTYLGTSIEEYFL